MLLRAVALCSVGEGVKRVYEGAVQCMWGRWRCAVCVRAVTLCSECEGSACHSSMSHQYIGAAHHNRTSQQNIRLHLTTTRQSGASQEHIIAE